MTTTATTADKALAVAARFRKAAADAIADTLDRDGDPIAEAKIWRAALKAAWSDALEDCGMPEEYARKLRFHL